MTPITPADGSISPAMRIACGSGCLAFGIFIVAAGFRLVDLQPARDVPHWIVAVAGAVITLAGVAILLPQKPSRAHDVIGALLLSGFALIGLWVGFGPGERAFSTRASAGAVSIGVPGEGEWPGRLAFGLGGVLVAAMAVWAWRRVFRPRDGAGKDAAPGPAGGER
jgi:hypothetical protein